MVKHRGEKQITAYQVKKESVQPGAKTHRGEDAQSKPVGAPRRLPLHGAHILQRPERTFNHMAETHTQNEENKRDGGRRGGGTEEGRGQAQSEESR